MKTVSKEEYQRRVEQASPPSPVGKDCLLAFLFGGAFFAAQDREKAKNLQIVHDFPGGKAYTTVSTQRYRVLIHLDLTAEIKEACL